MSTPRLVELAQPVEIGRCYRVPCVKIDDVSLTRGMYRSLNCLAWAPVWPQLHDDADIGFPEKHYHVDWRFVSDDDIRCVTVTAYGSQFRKAAIDDMLASCILLVIVKDSIIGGPVERVMRCCRNKLTWPSHHLAPERLEPKHKDSKLKCGRCPHWGFDLSTVKPNEHGIIQCPGHGLCFRADTGELVPRKEVEHALRTRAADPAPDVDLQGQG